MEERLYKVLSADGRACHGGSGKWPIGKWMPEIDDIRPCQRGYHLCRGLPEVDLVVWLGARIHPVLDISGDRIDTAGKIVVARAKIGPALETWNDCTDRLFAADCAEWAVKKFWRPKKFGLDYKHWQAPQKAIEAARQCARGEIAVAARDAAGDAAWAAAGDAAWAAAGDAAWDAARAAAWAAAGDAAGDAAWDAAWDAAGAAARDAAADAARDAARQWQVHRLFKYLNGELK